MRFFNQDQVSINSEAFEKFKHRYTKKLGVCSVLLPPRVGILVRRRYWQKKIIQGFQRA